MIKETQTSVTKENQNHQQQNKTNPTQTHTALTFPS